MFCHFFCLLYRSSWFFGEFWWLFGFSFLWLLAFCSLWFLVVFISVTFGIGASCNLVCLLVGCRASLLDDTLLHVAGLSLCAVWQWPAL